nr:hypothetical protein CFP56_25836 [Quercus suber]
MYKIIILHQFNLERKLEVWFLLLMHASPSASQASINAPFTTYHLACSSASSYPLPRRLREPNDTTLRILDDRSAEVARSFTLSCDGSAHDHRVNSS